MRIPRVPVLTLGLLSFAAAPLAAQITLEAGPMAGLVWSDLAGDDADDAASRLGFTAGGFLSIRPSEVLSAEIDILYAQRGAELDFVGDVGLTLDAKLDYIQIPVLAKAVVGLSGGANPLSAQLFAGPAVAFRVGCSVEGSVLGQSVETACEDVGLDLKTTDFAFVFGVAAGFRGVTLGARYDLGLTRIDESILEADIKNRALSVTLGYGFQVR